MNLRYFTTRAVLGAAIILILGTLWVRTSSACSQPDCKGGDVVAMADAFAEGSDVSIWRPCEEAAHPEEKETCKHALRRRE